MTEEMTRLLESVQSGRPLSAQDEADYRRYYTELCAGDTGPQLDNPQDYEWPRLEWRMRRTVGPVVLDVGCSTGEVCAMLTKQGYTVVGLDPSNRNIQWARQRYPYVPFVQGLLSDYARWRLSGWAMAVPNYDTVTCGDVIEHTFDPAEFLQDLKSIGHRVVVTTPLGVWDSPEHLHVFSEQDGQDLVRPYRGTSEVIYASDGRARWLGLILP